VRDVANDSAKHPPEWAVLHRVMERGVAHPSPDVQDAVARGEPVQPGDGVDVDQMRRTRQPERHDRH
jgi:hypothetical protein